MSELCATARRLQSGIQDLQNVDISPLPVSSAKSTYRRFVNLVKQLQKQTPGSSTSSSGGAADIPTGRGQEAPAKDLPDAIVTVSVGLSRIVDHLEDQWGVTFESAATST